MTDATADLRTVSWGDPGAPNTALLVHGLTGRTDVFRALADELLSDGPMGWRLLAADLRDAIPNCTLIKVENTNHKKVGVGAA
jgi:pimeloyl-ACP methyl ester carboxylesterase